MVLVDDVEYTGRTLLTAANVVEVHAPPYEDDLAIWLLHREEVA